MISARCSGVKRTIGARSVSWRPLVRLDATAFDVERALAAPDTALRLFGKPEVRGHRRMGVSLALGGSIEEARAKARAMTDLLRAGVRLD